MKILVLLALLLGVCTGRLRDGHKNDLMGGRYGHKTDDKSAIKVAEEALSQLNKGTNSIYHRRLGQLINADSQLVAGVLWHLDIIWGDTICRKNQKIQPEDVTKEKCPFKKDGKVEHCHLTYWVKQWLNFTKIEKFKCEATSRDMLFGHDAKKLLEKELIMRSNSPKQLTKFTRVTLRKTNGRKQLVGMSEFEDFMQLYNKQYTNAKEKMKRYRIFQANMWIAKQLQRHERGSAVYGATPYADYSLAEFRKYLLTPKWYDPGYHKKYAKIPKLDKLPKSFDWRDHNAVTPVKNQGMCGSCWAFSTTGNIEGLWAIKTGKLVSLSEQELVDCDKIDDGCSGGLPSQAYKAIMKLGGLESEKKYPYDARGETCEFKKTKVAAYINGSVKISQKEDEMAAWLVKNGPISIGINAFPMQFYMGGISHPWKIFCNPTHIDHGVLIVGYGVSDKNEPYWIIKNSWGPHWSRHNGYYLIYRGDGSCGLNTMATSAVIN